MAANGTTICLLGPKRGGKTTLLRTLRQCLLLEAYGYQPGIISSPVLNDISEQEFDEGLSEADERIVSRFPGGNYADEETIFASREEHLARGTGREFATQWNVGTIEYFFSLDWTPGLQHTDAKGSQTCLLEVVDAAGELSAPSGPQNKETEEALERHRAALDDALRIASAVIVVAPPADGRAERWATYLLDALERLQRTKARGRLKRVVVVFSQYDRLFARCGKEAAVVAVRWETVRYAIQREYVSRAAWMERMARLHRSTPDIEVRFTVASALGFVRWFGTPNDDPNPGVATAEPFRFRTNGSTDRDAAVLWCPFLTADPFIFAATGLVNPYMFTFEDIAGELPRDDQSYADAATDPGDDFQLEPSRPEDDEDAETTRRPDPPIPVLPPEPPQPSIFSRMFLRILQFFNAAPPTR